jgi:hypothetical protein
MNLSELLHKLVNLASFDEATSSEAHAAVDNHFQDKASNYQSPTTEDKSASSEVAQG